MAPNTPTSAPVEGQTGEKPGSSAPLTPEAKAALNAAADARAERQRLAESAKPTQDGEREPDEGSDPEQNSDTDTDSSSESSDTATTPPATPGNDKKPKSWWVGIFSSLSSGFSSASTWLGEMGGKFGDWLGGLLGLKPKDDKKEPEAGVDVDKDQDTDTDEPQESVQRKSYQEDVDALMKEFGLTATGDKKKNFFVVAVALGREVQAKYGIPYQVVVAQACLESGFGQSDLTQRALNCFGYKTGSSKVPYVTMQTVEYRNGVKGKEPAHFRAYTSLRESFMDYAALLSGASRYRKAFDYKNDPKRFLEEVIKGGYATDPNYVAKAEGAVSTYGLTLM